MSYRDEWRSLSAKMDAVGAMTSRFSPAIAAVPSGSTHYALIKDAGATVMLEAERTWILFEDFLTRYRSMLPAAAGSLKQEWSQRRDVIAYQRDKGQDTDPVRASIAWGVLLEGARAEMDRLLADDEMTWCTVTERAFEHLQRTIVVSAAHRADWQNAHATSEPACEALGAVHLLAHGVWAFKANATGERTDLVLGDVMDASRVEKVERAGSALVLTEWKRTGPSLSPKAAIDGIETQIARYRRGAVASVELKQTCYGVIVSAKMTPMPADKHLAGYRVRFLNVAVDPEVPSRS